jgi:hypothetical protein
MIEAMQWIVTGLGVVVGSGILALWIGFLVISAWASSDHGPGDPPLLPQEDDE